MINLHLMVIPASVLADGIDWFTAPLQQPKPQNHRARKQAAASAALSAKIKSDWAETNENRRYADYLLAREIALTAAAAKRQAGNG